MDRKEWLASLKVGDEVGVTEDDRHFIEKVDRLGADEIGVRDARHGFVRTLWRSDVLAGDRLVNLHPITPEFVRLAERHRLIDRIKSVPRSLLTDSQLARIVAILDEGK